MQHSEKPMMEVWIETDQDHIVSFDSKLGKVTMIPFKGSVDSEIFKGIVEPCGVDTQITNQNEVRHMSARYVLTGKDSDGKDCHIYIENNGWFTDGAMPRPFRTVPTFLTDSEKLAPYLHCNRFVGEGLRDDTGLWIRFYELTD